MVILELALFGIRNFTQLTRLAFKPGLNLVQGGNGSGKSTLCDSLFAVLSPISETPVESLKTRKSSDACQAGLIFKTKNGRAYRLVRDFRNSKSSLAESDASNKFHVTMEDEEPIAQFLAETFGGLTRNRLEGLYSMKAAWMPSARPITADRSKAGPSLSVPASPPVASGDTRTIDTRTIPHDPSKKQKRLDELKALLAKGDQLAAMEDQLSDLQARSAEAKRRLRLATEKTDALALLARQGGNFDSLKELPGDYQTLLENSEHQEQLKNEQMTSITEEVEFLKEDLLTIPNQPFFLNKYFIAGGGLTLAALVLLTVLNLEGLYQNLLMLVMLTGIGLMGYAGFLDFIKLNKRRGIEQKIREAERKRTRLESAFKKENGPCIALLKKTDCADIASLRGKIKTYEQFLTTRRQLETERDQFLGSKTIEELQQTVAALTIQISEVEANLKAASSLPSDIYLIQEEVRVLERELAAPVSAEAPMEFQPFQSPLMSDAPPPSIPESRPAHFLPPAFREGLSAASVQTVLREHLSDLKNQMTRMTGELLGPIEAEMSVREDLAPVLLDSAKAPIPWEYFSSGQRDLFHLIHQLAVIRLLSRSHPFPLVLDNPLPALDPPHQQKVLDILREIAQNRQVIFLSTVAHPNREGDHLIQLK